MIFGRYSGGGILSGTAGYPRSAKKDMAQVRKWIIPLQRHVTDQLHFFENVDFTSVDRAEVGVGKKALPQSCYYPLKRKVALQVNDLVGKKANDRPSWPSFNYKSSLTQQSDWSAIVFLAQSGDWAKLELCWFSLLAPAGTLIKFQGSDQWWFSVGVVGMRSVLCWPAVKGKSAAGELFYPSLTISRKDLQLRPILDPHAVTVQPVEWRGPLFLEQNRKARAQSPQAAATLTAALAIDSEEPLIVHACKKAFWKLPVSLVSKVARHFHVEHEAHADLFSLLTSLVRHFIPEATESCRHQILQLRVPCADHEEVTAVSQDVLHECLDEEDLEEVMTTESEQKKNKDSLSNYAKQLRRLRTSLSVPIAEGQAVKKGKKVKLPAFSEFSKISQEEALVCMPPAMSIVKDMRNGRWYCRDVSFSCSRSFRKYTEAVALALVIEAAWAWRGLDQPHGWATKLAKSVERA